MLSIIFPNSLLLRIVARFGEGYNFRVEVGTVVPSLFSGRFPCLIAPYVGEVKVGLLWLGLVIVIESLRCGWDNVEVGILEDEFGVVIAVFMNRSKLEKSTVVVATVCCAFSIYDETLNFCLFKCAILPVYCLIGCEPLCTLKVSLPTGATALRSKLLPELNPEVYCPLVWLEAGYVYIDF